MGLLKGIFTIVAVVVLAVVGIGAYLYFTDYAAQATVTERGSDHVVVTPKLLPSYHYRVALDSTTASVVCVGYQVEFHVNTHALKVTDATGVVVYEKDANGRETKNTGAALRCGASNGGIAV